MNVPSALDPTLAPPGRHVVSIEVLYTPHSLEGGWNDSGEPARWLNMVASLFEDDFLASIVDWRAMTPDRYEREFHLPLGHAASFAGVMVAGFISIVTSASLATENTENTELSIFSTCSGSSNEGVPPPK